MMSSIRQIESRRAGEAARLEAEIQERQRHGRRTRALERRLTLVRMDLIAMRSERIRADRIEADRTGADQVGELRAQVAALADLVAAVIVAAENLAARQDVVELAVDAVIGRFVEDAEVATGAM